MHTHTCTCTRTVSEFAEESSSHSLLCNIFQAKSGNQWAVSDITDRSMHQPTRNHNGDTVAEKGTSENDDDMDITQCLSSSIVTSNVKTGSTTAFEESQITRYRNICML